MISPLKQKNNHFVPRSYLRRFSAGSERQIALYNIKSGRTIASAPIKSQCSRDYFYTKNPIFEQEFSKLEGRQNSILNQIIITKTVPPRGSQAHLDLLNCVMFQSGRTATTVDHTDHMLNEFGKAYLRHHLTREGESELLEYLPKVRLKTINAVLDAIGEHLLMHPLIEDLDCTLFLNKSSEEFLTSDHPVALCNGMPTARAVERTLGFASRGLLILYPISPRAFLFFSDAEVYKTEQPGSTQALYRSRDVVELNLAQFGNAFENVYFSDQARVQQTLEAFRRRSATVRPPPSTLTESAVTFPDGRRGIVLNLPSLSRRLPLPKPVEIRYAVRSKKYKTGTEMVRDPERAQLVSSVLRNFRANRDAAAEKADSEDNEESDV